MSVNEVKLQKAAEEFVMRGTGPPSSRTICIGNEDHTLGNALRHVLVRNQDVNFCGYSVPHPAEPVVQIRIQTNGPTALETLHTACSTLSDQCDVILERLEDLLPHVKEDRIELEAKLMEETEEVEEDAMEE